MSSELTPMMRQYMEIKDKNRDSILFFRLGDFYEMFFEDAIEATRILHITLTSRNCGKGKKAPMCGVPYHAAESYIARLVKHGRKVAICEQVEEATPGKKLVKRDITKIITPGTFIADEILDEAVNNYILSLTEHNGNYGLAYADISTGEFRLTEITEREDLFSEIYKISPAECLVGETFSEGADFEEIKDVNVGAVTVGEDWKFDFRLSARELTSHFNVTNLEGFGCQDLEVAVGAAGALLRYLKDTQKVDLNNIDNISTYRSDEYMALDRSSHRHLELVENQEDMGIKGTLFDVLDSTATPMGKRRLKWAILNPLMNVHTINSRLDAVGYFYDKDTVRSDVRSCLSEIYDIERLSNRVSLGTANARDLVSLSLSLKKISVFKAALSGNMPTLVKALLDDIDDFKYLTDLIDESLVDEPPLALKDGGLIRGGYDPDVDELRDIVDNGKDWVASLRKQEIDRTGISSLKIGYNKVFGYYIEVTKANLKDVPDDYIRKQTLVNAERFITQELKEQESRIIGAQDKIKALEYRIFSNIRDKAGAKIDRLKVAADKVADLDLLSSLAETAAVNAYIRPEVNDGNEIHIKEGRHPVLEKLLKDKDFVPNDLDMDPEENRIFIITGSNMAGKSTFIRQVALITIMAQMGGFVPAEKAEIGVVDRIFTRVGASDRLYRGMSTFMVEMVETANILNNATGRSLIILDEIGRGTSTFDGVSIAWSVVEYIHHRIKGAKTMFATHYHELTELTGLMPGVRNYHLAVQEWGEDIVFLYRVADGSCDESFGIHVAKLAGMPDEVVKRSREILDNLRNDSLRGNIRARFSDDTDPGNGRQLDLFSGSPGEDPVRERIKNMDIDNMTPVQALKLLSELRNETRGG